MGGPCGQGSWVPTPVSPQSLLVMSPEKRKLAAQARLPAEALPEEQAPKKLHTLEEFSYSFFRCHPSATRAPLGRRGHRDREVLLVSPGKEAALRAYYHHLGLSAVGIPTGTPLEQGFLSSARQ